MGVMGFWAGDRRRQARTLACLGQSTGEAGGDQVAGGEGQRPRMVG